MRNAPVIAVVVKPAAAAGLGAAIERLIGAPVSTERMPTARRTHCMLRDIRPAIVVCATPRDEQRLIGWLWEQSRGLDGVRFVVLGCSSFTQKLAAETERALREDEATLADAA